MQLKICAWHRSFYGGRYQVPLYERRECWRPYMYTPATQGVIIIGWRHCYFFLLLYLRRRCLECLRISCGDNVWGVHSGASWLVPDRRRESRDTAAGCRLDRRFRVDNNRHRLKELSDPDPNAFTAARRNSFLWYAQISAQRLAPRDISGKFVFGYSTQ